MRISDWSSDVCSSDLTNVVPVDGADEGELLALAVAVEALSDHPLAQAIVKDGRERLNDRAVPTAGDLKSLTGRGVTASVDGETVWIGKAEMFGSEGIPALGQGAQNAIAKLRENGRTTMVVRKGDRDLGAIGLMRSEEHTSELQSLMRISYAVFCLTKKNISEKRK